MVFTQLVLARRKPGITHEEFRARYERHMAMVMRLVGPDVQPLRHTRRYVVPRSAPRPPLSAPAPPLSDAAPPLSDAAPTTEMLPPGNIPPGSIPFNYDVVVEIIFANPAHRDRFVDALTAPDVERAVLDDEADFWDRCAMSIAAVDEVQETIVAM